MLTFEIVDSFIIVDTYTDLETCFATAEKLDDISQVLRCLCLLFHEAWIVCHGEPRQ